MYWWHRTQRKERVYNSKIKELFVYLDSSNYKSK